MKTQYNTERISSDNLAYSGAGIGGVAGYFSHRDSLSRMGPHYKSKSKLLKKIQTGDIVLRGKKSYRSEIGRRKGIRAIDRLFWGGMKSGAGSITPHGILAEKWKRGIVGYHQVDRPMTWDLPDLLKKYERVSVVRPIATKIQKQKAIKSAEKIIEKGHPYNIGKAFVQSGSGYIFPKKVRDLCAMGKVKGEMCTGFVGKAYEGAGVKLKGKGTSLLAKDIHTSKKVIPVGWFGAKPTIKEKIGIKYAPKVLRTALYGLVGAGAAYGLNKMFRKKEA